MQTPKDLEMALNYAALAIVNDRGNGINYKNLYNYSRVAMQVLIGLVDVDDTTVIGYCYSYAQAFDKLLNTLNIDGVVSDSMELEHNLTVDSLDGQVYNLEGKVSELERLLEDAEANERYYKLRYNKLIEVVTDKRLDGIVPSIVQTLNKEISDKDSLIEELKRQLLEQKTQVVEVNDTINKGFNSQAARDLSVNDNDIIKLKHSGMTSYQIGKRYNNKKGQARPANWVDYRIDSWMSRQLGCGIGVSEVCEAVGMTKEVVLNRVNKFDNKRSKGGH